MIPSNVQKEAATALARAEPLSFAECNQLLLQVGTALGMASERADRTRPADTHRADGPERLKALQTGSQGDVRKVEQEYEEARVLVSQLQAQRDELSRRRGEARLSEAIDSLPGLYKGLDRCLEAAEAAKSEFVAKLAELQRVAESINAARGSMRYGNVQPAGGATIGTLQRLEALNPAFEMDSTVRRRPQDWMHLVGCALEEGIVKLARVKCPGVDLRKCASDVDVMRAVVAARKGDDALNGMKDEDVARTFQSLSIVERERIVA